MKKTIIILMILILLFSSIASASFMGNGFKFITGATIEDVVGVQEGEETPIEEPVQESPVEKPIEETPIEEPVQETPIEGQPIQESPVEDNFEGQPINDQKYEEKSQEGCYVGEQRVPCPNEQQQNNYQQPQYDQKQYQQKQYSPSYTQTICGDGICEGDEKYGCQDDCGFTEENPMNQFNGDYQKQMYGDDWCANGVCCPDGICDDFEQKMGACSLDCGGDSSEYNGEYNQYDQQNTYEVKEEIDATEALTIILKLEEIKMRLSTDGKLYQQIKNLYEYCESKGTEDCSRYENALAMMIETSSSIEDLMSDLKTSIESKGKLTQEDLMKLKNNIGNVVDKGMLKITYALIGVDINVEEIIVEETETSYDENYVAECGNGLCEPDYGEEYSNCPTDCMEEVVEETPIEETIEEVVEETPIEETIEEVVEETPIEETVEEVVE